MATKTDETTMTATHMLNKKRTETMRNVLLSAITSNQAKAMLDEIPTANSFYETTQISAS